MDQPLFPIFGRVEILDRTVEIWYNRNRDTATDITDSIGRSYYGTEESEETAMNEIRKQDERGAYLLGSAGIRNLREAHVAVFGIGGVGSYAVEALARAGVGALTLVDHDTVSESNINRQLIALHSTVGRFKTDVARDRIADIDPLCTVTVRHEFFLPENADSFDFSSFDYVIDAVDTVSAKIELAVRAEAAGTPIISCMGAGNKLDPTRFTVTDIYKTAGDPLARVMRTRLRKCGVKALKVVCSEEPPSPHAPEFTDADTEKKGDRRAPGSLSFVPSVAGLVAAGEVIRALAGISVSHT